MQQAAPHLDRFDTMTDQWKADVCTALSCHPPWLSRRLSCHPAVYRCHVILPGICTAVSTVGPLAVSCRVSHHHSGLLHVRMSLLYKFRGRANQILS